MLHLALLVLLIYLLCKNTSVSERFSLNKWRIDETGRKVNVMQEHSQTFPIVSKKSAVPKSWKDTIFPY